MKIGIISRSTATVASLRGGAAAAVGVDVVWVHASTDAAIDELRASPVDLVLFDVDSVDPRTAALGSARPPVPPVIAVTTRGDAGTSRVYEAMSRGAVDAVALDKAPSDLSRVLRGHHPVSEPVSFAGAAPIVALGASTGGPAALLTVLHAFRGSGRTAIVICQHVEASFDDDMVAWLGRESGLPSTSVVARTMPQAGHVYVAAPGAHLVLDGGHLTRSAIPSGTVHLPSIDVLFHSLAKRARRQPIAGALLTGMGRDGADGLLAMRRAGCFTVAQDEATSVVYSMPRAARELGAAARVLPLDAIGPTLVSHVAGLEALA